jgi:hypothetical protein
MRQKRRVIKQMAGDRNKIFHSKISAHAGCNEIDQCGVHARKLRTLSFRRNLFAS